MDSAQATAFGFPSPLIGLAAFPVVVTIGVVLLRGFRPPRWFWLGMQAGTTFGVGFVHWLIYSSLYDIGALCPYCMVAWVVTIPIFWYTTLHNLMRGNLTPGNRQAALGLARYHSVCPRRLVPDDRDLDTRSLLVLLANLAVSLPPA